MVIERFSKPNVPLTTNFAVRFRVGREVLLVTRSEQRLCWPVTLLSVWVRASKPYHHGPDKLSGPLFFVERMAVLGLFLNKFKNIEQLVNSCVLLTTINFAVRFRVGIGVLLVTWSERRLCWPVTLLNVWVRASKPYHHGPDKLSGPLFFCGKSGGLRVVFK